MPAPEVGQPLPRAEDAVVEEVKCYGYVLADACHGPHWRRVFRVEPAQSDALREAIVEVAATASVTAIRQGGHGPSYRIDVELTFNGRTAPVRLIWFYDRPDAPPRLVTAYPTP